MNVRVVWSASADRDFESIVDFIAKDNPFAAIEQGDRIQDTVERLQRHPKSGRVGRSDGTRETVVAYTPFVVVYRIQVANVVEVVRVLHGAQQWPPETVD